VTSGMPRIVSVCYHLPKKMSSSVAMTESTVTAGTNRSALVDSKVRMAGVPARGMCRIDENALTLSSRAT
jgi:hypothetical protein